MKTVVFIGKRFYIESGTIMSSICLKTEHGFQRYNWGFLQAELENGEKFIIRQASQEELASFEKQLAGIRRE